MTYTMTTRTKDGPAIDAAESRSIADQPVRRRTRNRRTLNAVDVTETRRCRRW
jgi:hypothetical protein